MYDSSSPDFHHTLSYKRLDQKLICYNSLGADIGLHCNTVCVDMVPEGRLSNCIALHCIGYSVVCCIALQQNTLNCLLHCIALQQIGTLIVRKYAEREYAGLLSMHAEHELFVVCCMTQCCLCGAVLFVCVVCWLLCGTVLLVWHSIVCGLLCGTVLFVRHSIVCVVHVCDMCDMCDMCVTCV